MQHSTELANELLDAKFERYQDGAMTRYRPTAPDAHRYWMYTGVCPVCFARAVLSGECKECGYEPQTDLL